MTASPTVSTYMTTDLFTLTPETEINRAMIGLLGRRYSGAPVVDAAGRLVGVLSKKDCLRAAFNAAYHRTWGGTVADYMTPDPTTVDANLPLPKAVELFLESPYRRFPVMRDGHLVGQISRADVMQAIVDEWETNGLA